MQARRVSVGEPGTEAGEGGAAVDWVPAVANDGSAIYFTAFNALASGGKHETPAGNGEEGEVNVYRYNTENGTTNYVATVDTKDFMDEAECASVMRPLADIGPCATVNWYTNPDGQYLLFDSSLPIGGNNLAVNGCQTLPSEQGAGDGRCQELYRYDASAVESGGQALVCVSCGPGNVDSVGSAEFARSATTEPTAGVVAGISDNGGYVFFDSQAKLVPQAENHTLDVYEWEAQGLDGCVRVQGCVSLIGSPT